MNTIIIIIVCYLLIGIILDIAIITTMFIVKPEALANLLSTWYFFQTIVFWPYVLLLMIIFWPYIREEISKKIK